MKQDELYLGYYLHLIQDIFYRYFIYSEHDWNPTIPGNIDHLHRDYAITNWHVVNRYKLNKEMADEFIKRSTAFCLEEMKNLSEGKKGLDSFTWSWERH